MHIADLPVGKSKYTSLRGLRNVFSRPVATYKIVILIVKITYHSCYAEYGKYAAQMLNWNKEFRRLQVTCEVISIINSQVKSRPVKDADLSWWTCTCLGQCEFSVLRSLPSSFTEIEQSCALGNIPEPFQFPMRYEPLSICHKSLEPGLFKNGASLPRNLGFFGKTRIQPKMLDGEGGKRPPSLALTIAPGTGDQYSKRKRSMP